MVKYTFVPYRSDSQGAHYGSDIIINAPVVPKVGESVTLDRNADSLFPEGGTEFYKVTEVAHVVKSKTNFLGRVGKLERITVYGKFIKERQD